MASVMRNKVDDICMVPLTIKYGKVLESGTFPSELLGEDKVDTSEERRVGKEGCGLCISRGAGLYVVIKRHEIE